MVEDEACEAAGAFTTRSSPAKGGADERVDGKLARTARPSVALSDALE